MAFEHLSHERYVYAYSGEINKEDIDPQTGSHDELLDWGYASDSELLVEVESLVFDSFKDMLEHSSEVMNEPTDPEAKIVSEEVLSALGVLAASLENNFTQVVMQE